jgi:hypothetical protein
MELTDYPWILKFLRRKDDEKVFKQHDSDVDFVNAPFRPCQP